MESLNEIEFNSIDKELDTIIDQKNILKSQLYAIKEKKEKLIHIRTCLKQLCKLDKLQLNEYHIIIPFVHNIEHYIPNFDLKYKIISGPSIIKIPDIQLNMVVDACGETLFANESYLEYEGDELLDHCLKFIGDALKENISELQWFFEDNIFGNFYTEYIKYFDDFEIPQEGDWTCREKYKYNTYEMVTLNVKAYKITKI